MATNNQKIVFDRVAEKIHKAKTGGKVGKISISKEIKESGVYGKNYIKNPQKLTRSKGWHELEEQYLGDTFLAKKHKDLLNHKQLDYFVFPKKMEDEEIEEHLNSFKIEVVAIRWSDKGKMAFYQSADPNAIKAGLDMAYKLKGKYAPEKHVSVVAQISDEKKAKIRRILGLT